MSLGLYVKIWSVGASGKINSPHFLFWDPSISQKLMELGSCRPLRVLGFYVKKLSAMGELLIPLFILELPPYLRNLWS